MRPTQPETFLLVSKDNAATQLDEQVSKGILLKNMTVLADKNNSHEEYTKWNDYNIELLERIFNTRRYALQYDRSNQKAAICAYDLDRYNKSKRLAGKIDANINSLQSIRDKINIIPSKSDFNEDIRMSSANINNKVFVVHGHDNFAKESVARVLKDLKLEPIILHEQPNGGKTIIEKFEKHSDVGFAVVLLTPDDFGYKYGNENTKLPRARQNVIFELGYFIGKIGRQRVCAICKGELETPSDILGVIWIQMGNEDNGWKLSLCNELKHAGFQIDLNDLI